jgi:hypothetical protein
VIRSMSAARATGSRTAGHTQWDREEKRGEDERRSGGTRPVPLTGRWVFGSGVCVSSSSS